MFSMRVCLVIALSTLAVSPPTAAQQTPARDRAPVLASDSSVRGRVLADEDRTPLIRARVTLTTGDNRSRPEPVYTDGEGRFEFQRLPAGRYTLTISKTGYVWGRLGGRDVERSVQFDLARATVLDNLEARLIRAAAISGQLVDDLGDPILAASVSVGTLQRNEGRLVMATLRSTVTDDRGEFRLSGLFAGSYVLRVEAASAGTLLPGAPDEWRRNITWAPSYFPGTAELSSAQRLTLKAGEDRSGVDFIVRPEPLQGGRLTIVVNDLAGNPARGTVRLSGRSLSMTTALQKGRVRMPNPLPPGDYSVTARGADGVAVARIVMGGGDAELALTLGRGARVSGRVVVEGDAPADLTQIPLAVSISDRASDSPPFTEPPRPLKVNADGTFAVPDLVGSLNFRSNRPQTWQVRSVMYDGRDLLDSPIELSGGEELANVRILVTNQIPTLTGTVVDSDRVPVVGCSALVFPEDQEAWRTDRLLRRVRSDLNGRFRIANLIAGNYFVVALAKPDPLDWSTQEYLAALRPGATRVTLDAGKEADVALHCLEQP